MAGLYLVGAWLVTQVAGTILPMLGAPDWVGRTVLALLAIGFVPALVFSWLYELTPEGLKRDAEVRPGESNSTETGRRMDRLIFVGLLALVAVIVAERWWPHTPLPATSESLSMDPDASTGPAAASDQGDAATIAAAIAPNTIAVLPFVDLSPEGDQAWFADGISEEVLNVLVGVDGLTVASRTSSFQFRAQEALGVPAIAAMLKVRHVLEGSVRKAGDRIRITAQLIDSTRDAHLWSETFDRTLSTENLFDIQDEIARAIVAAIGANLELEMAVAAPAPQRTDNLDAYSLYLQARPRYNARENLKQLDEMLARAVELDPGFVDALALRASVVMLRADYRDPASGLRLTRAPGRLLAEQALALQPGHGLALGVLAQVEAEDMADGRAVPRSIAGIMEGFDAAIAADPRNVDLLNWRGRWRAYLGRFAEAEADFRLCHQLEPAYSPCRINRAGVLIVLGRRDEARRELVDAAAGGAMTPAVITLIALRALDMREAFYMIGSANPNLRGWYDFAALYEALGQPTADHAILRSRIFALLAPSRDGASDLAAEMEILMTQFRSSEIALLMTALGDPRGAPANWISWLPGMAVHRQSSGFRASVREGGRLRYWQEHGFPAQCRAVGTDDFVCD